MDNQQKHLRRDNRDMTTFKRAMILMMCITCVATITTCFHARFFLHHSLVPALMVGDTTSSLQVIVSTSPTEGAVEKTPRAWRLDNDTLRFRGFHGRHPLRRKEIPQQQLDFIVAGFPKTGTTSLLSAFGGHPETDIASQERCGVVNPMTSDLVAFGRLQESLSELSANASVKRAIKCPNTVYHAYGAITRLEQYAPNTMFVVGVRHPIELVQSYYNYRISELYDRQKRAGPKKRMELIPPLDSLVGVTKEWKGVSTDCTRFESYLMQFGKTKVEAMDMQAMISNSTNPIERKKHHWAVKPNRFSIFLYALEQLEDTNDEERSESFRRGLQQFLGLQKPLKAFPRKNRNHFVGSTAHPETVDICLPKYTALRGILLKQGGRSAEWIESEFMQSPDVFVANEDHFLESIRSWYIDPCGDTDKRPKPRNHTY